MTSLIDIRRSFGALLVSSSSDPTHGPTLPRVRVSQHETSPEKRDRTLKHLLRANHHNYAVMFSRLRFHNHLPHVLGSAYLLGASAELLQRIYDDGAPMLDEWEDSPQEITADDWRDFLGDKAYQRAYLDFFEDELVRMNYNWKDVVIKYMLVGPEPLLHGAIGGLGHTLIHLGYAFELNSRELAMEALVLATTNYNFLHQYIDADFPNDASTTVAPPGTKSPGQLVEILEEIRADSRFDGIFEKPGADNIVLLFELRQDVVLHYYHQLSVTADNVLEAHYELTRLATMLLLCTSPSDTSPQFNFFICHLLTTAYAVRTLLPELPSKSAPAMIKAHWLFVVVVYCIVLRPKIRPEVIDRVDVGGKSWDDIAAKALSQDRCDEHYVKSVRTFKETAELLTDQDEFYRKAAVKFAWEFSRWEGMGVVGEE